MKEIVGVLENLRLGIITERKFCRTHKVLYQYLTDRNVIEKEIGKIPTAMSQTTTVVIPTII